VTQIEHYPSSPQEHHCAVSVSLSEEVAPHDQDEDLLLALRTGSSAAFNELQKCYSKGLYRRILSITRNHEDAEDALQDTFMRAFLAFDSFQGRSHLSTWLTRIAINSALMVIRRRRGTCAEISLTPLSQSEACFPEFDIRDSAPTPEEICAQKQGLDRMFSAIERLDPKSRIAIKIQIIEECSLKEIAHTLDLSVTAVKSRLHRARKSLAGVVDHRSDRFVSQKQGGFELQVEQRYA
jgi:RNA polymerase sigma-70 factor, ECF subfamily